jgi:hypothetical protein
LNTRRQSAAQAIYAAIDPESGSPTLTLSQLASDSNTEREFMSEQEIRAQKFTLVDEKGVVRAVLTTAEGLASLALSDGDGNIRAVVSVTASGDPSIALYDCSGKQRALLDVGTSTDGATALGLYDQQERGRLLLNLKPNGTPLVALFDGHGNEIAKMP